MRPQRWNIYCLSSVANRYFLHILQVLAADLEQIIIYNLEIMDFQTFLKYSSTLETLAQSLNNDDIHPGQFRLLIFPVMSL